MRDATQRDVEAIVVIVNGAYRGEGSRRGWTTEADLLDGIRTDAAEIASLIERPDSTILLAEQGAALVGTVLLQDRGSAAYLGMLVVDPARQAGGLGKEILRAAEALVVARWGASKISMTVLEQRSELIAFYERRGFRRTGRYEPFPADARSTPRVEGLRFEVLEKPLPA